MINMFVVNKEKRNSGLDFYLKMSEVFIQNLKENFQTQDNYVINGIKVIVNQKGNIAFSEKNDELISIIQEKTGYKLRNR